jgi:hypothetical protein
MRTAGPPLSGRGASDAGFGRLSELSRPRLRTEPGRAICDARKVRAGCGNFLIFDPLAGRRDQGRVCHVMIAFGVDRLRPFRDFDSLPGDWKARWSPICVQGPVPFT